MAVLTNDETALVQCAAGDSSQQVAADALSNSRREVVVAVQAFPHPLARLNAIKDTRVAGYRNYLSYMAVDEFTYTGMPSAPSSSCLCF